jgi:hypothetical protein
MQRQLPSATARRQRLIQIAVVLLFLLFFGRSICSTVIDYYWWRELGQVPTWLRMSLYRYAPGCAAWVVVLVILWIAHARGMRKAGERLRDHRLYSWIVTLALAVVALIVSLAAVDGWTVARYFGGHGSSPTTEWRDTAC